ncbi:MAG: DM13 domain-containing protein [Parvularculaceae bacterium]
MKAMPMLRAAAAAAFAVVAAAFAPAAAQDAAETSAEAAGETLLHSGSWTKPRRGYDASGTWSIVERDGSRYVVLSDDFRTQRAPDLKLFLSPQQPGDITGKNATDGAALIAPLSSPRGGQTHEIPADIDLASYTSIIIHCQKFSKIWSVAAL